MGLTSAQGWLFQTFLANGAGSIGGAEGDRTPDLMNAIHALSQLSYGPVVFSLGHFGLA